MQNPIATTALSCSLVLLSDSSPHLANENLTRGAQTIDRVTRDIVQNKNSVASRATRLIIVAGQSVLVSGNVQNAAFDDSVWFLYDYQRGRGLPRAIVSHIRAGIRLALDDRAACSCSLVARLGRGPGRRPRGGATSGWPTPWT